MLGRRDEPSVRSGNHDEDRWRAQVGPALSESDVADLLGRSQQEVADDPHLLRIDSAARSVYPVMQFDGDRLVKGLAEVIDIVTSHTTVPGVAAWLTGTLPALADCRPIDLLRSGEVDAVIAAAHRFAANARA